MLDPEDDLVDVPVEVVLRPVLVVVETDELCELAEVVVDEESERWYVSPIDFDYLASHEGMTFGVTIGRHAGRDTYQQSLKKRPQ